MWDRDELHQAEGALFEDAAFGLIDAIRVDLPDSYRNVQHDRLLDTGIDSFDRLEATQQLYLVNQVTELLLNSDLEAPASAVYFDATIAAVFSWLCTLVSLEIDVQNDSRTSEEGDTSMRRLVLLASAAGDEQSGDRIGRPDAECTVLETWEDEILLLRDRVLWDDDWALAESALDLPPEKAVALKKKMGIEGDYFTAIPPEVTREQAGTAWCDFVERATGTRPARWRFTYNGGISMVSLDDLLHAVEMPSDEMSCFLDKGTGTFHHFENSVIEHLDSAGADDNCGFSTPAEEIHRIRKLFEEDKNGNLVQLPSRFDIQESLILKDFSQSVRNEEKRARLLASIDSKDAFRRFQEAAEELGLLESWYKFRNRAVKRIVAQWLEEREIPWEPDNDVPRL